MPHRSSLRRSTGGLKVDESPIPRMVIAGVQGGSGKTSIALGIVTALRERGRTVQTFKVGPDFNDCAYLAHASRRPCRNLDAWMLGGDGVRRSFTHGLEGADVAVVEGVMGLFDSHGAGDGSAHPYPGSTAEVAELIGAPVVLVLDVAGMGETAAAIALGLRQLAGNLDIAGVILDNVPGGDRRQVVEDAIWERAKLPVLGALPHLPSVHIPELRSGLLPLGQNPHVDVAIAALGQAVTRHCDLDLIERVMARARPISAPPPVTGTRHAEPLRVGVAYDDAFCFYYAENLELLEAQGAEIVTFSPLEDPVLPRDLDAVYIGGGLSEIHVPRLSGNRSFIESVRRAHAQGLPIYGECGGLLYCARSARASDGSVHEMCGLVPVDIVLEPGAWRTGYRDLKLATDSLLGSRGDRIRGHEFHITRLLSTGDTLSHAYAMHDADGEPLGCEGWASGNLLASFVHVHFGQSPAIAASLLERAGRHREERRLQTAQV
jgi:cobyrinic acid a,c-diamide synthase